MQLLSPLLAVIIGTLLVHRQAQAAKPDPPETITTVGSQKLATASDCSKPVAFSGTSTGLLQQDGRLVLKNTLLDQGVGYAASTGTFTTHCPGLYQFSFANTAGSRLTLKLKSAKDSDSEFGWKSVASAPTSGSQLVLLRMLLGDQVALFVDKHPEETLDDATTFSGYRIAKE